MDDDERRYLEMAGRNIEEKKAENNIKKKQEINKEK